MNHYEEKDNKHHHSIEGWTIGFCADVDNHLTIWIEHEDGTVVHQIQADIGKDDKTDWSDRFTTEGIEERRIDVNNYEETIDKDAVVTAVDIVNL